jgi:hypothetical protein
MRPLAPVDPRAGLAGHQGRDASRPDSAAAYSLLGRVGATVSGHLSHGTRQIR